MKVMPQGVYQRSKLRKTNSVTETNNIREADDGKKQKVKINARS